MINRRLESKLGFDKVRGSIADRCATEYASSRVSEEVFSDDPQVIGERLALTDEMRLILMFEDNFPTTGYIDALPILEPLEKQGWNLDLLGICKLKTLLDTTRRICAFFGSIKDGIYPRLGRMAKPISYFPEVVRRIEGIIDRYGEIKDSASDELLKIRRELRSKEAEISKRAEALLRSARAQGYAGDDATVTIRDGKYLIPVASSAKRKIQGFVYDESSSGRTTFIEPAEIIELENEITELHFAQAREIARILAEFTDFLRPYVPELMDAARFIGEMDFLMAKAQTALDIIAGAPIISQDGIFSLRKARHPLLEKALRKEGRQMVPLTIELGKDKRILLISGPNAGGKSVCLKTAGLLQYMFQWGMLIPTSESSELPVFKRIMVSIGDDQSLENDLSTYSSFLADMRQMLREADPETMVLIDEFGSGTEPAAGGAIAEAILSELDKKGVYGIITTHYTNLKLYASNQQNGVINGAMLFDAAKIEPLFKLDIGMPGNSFAFELARKMHLPEEIVKDAEQRAGREYVGIERNLRKIARNRRALDEKLQKVKATGRNLEEISEKYRKELEDVRQMKESIIEDAKKEAENIVKGAGRQVEKTIREIKESGADKEKTKAARAELSGFMAALEQRQTRQSRRRDEYIERKLEKLSRGKPVRDSEQKKASDPLKPGEKVRIKDNGMAGEVARVSGKSVVVIVGNISTTIDASRVERISSNEYKEASKQHSKPVYQKNDAAIAERKLRFSPEIDVRGERVQDALGIITGYIDDAIMLSMGSVRIIHGKGTGALREELQKYLRTVPGVKEVSDEDVRQGGTGVTIVKFE